MKTYAVTITATVTKTYMVKARNKDAAHDLAHECFSVLNDDAQERYDQQTDSVKEVKP
jgi:hypothetical protein